MKNTTPHLDESSTAFDEKVLATKSEATQTVRSGIAEKFEPFEPRTRLEIILNEPLVD